MKLGVCVPYRNREKHLKRICSTKLVNILNKMGIEYCMYFGHQVDEHLFNRGVKMKKM